MKKCTSCGAQNRDNARFCSVCRNEFQLYSVQQLPGNSLPPTIRTIFTPLMPKPGSLAKPSMAGRIWQRILRIWGPVAVGKIEVCDPPRDSSLPFDISRALVIVSIVLALTGVMIFAFMFSLAFFLVLAILGTGVVCLLPAILSGLAFIIGPILYWLRSSKNYPLVNFQVMDEQTGAPVSIVIYIKDGGMPRLGDRVRIFGRRQPRSGQIIAQSVEVYESNGHPVNYRVYGAQTWPWWVGLFALAIVIIGYFWLLHSLFS